jgi:hypothetical protein
MKKVVFVRYRITPTYFATVVKGVKEVLHEIYSNNVSKLIQRFDIELKQEIVKMTQSTGLEKELLRERLRKIMNSLLIVSLTIRPSLVEKYKNAKGLLSMELNVIHTALLMLLGSRIKSLQKAEKLYEFVKGSGTATEKIAEFLVEYFKYAEKFKDVMDWADWSSIRASIVDDKNLQVQLGEHMVTLKFKNNGIELSYYDHNEKRIYALTTALKRLVQADIKIQYSDYVKAIIGYEQIKALAVILASTTSLDVQGKIWILEKANSLEELIKLRLGTS